MMSMAALAFASGMMAQDNQLSFGLDLALPMGDFADFASFGVGPAVGFELPVGDALGITIQVAYDFLTPNSDVKDVVKSTSMIPAQVGLKYYFMDQQEGFYGHGQLGVHATNTTFETSLVEDQSSTNFSWAIGPGYQLEKLDVGLRFNSISTDADAPDGTSSSTYIGLRVAYLLPIGG